jgi:hypothetical protein
MKKVIFILLLFISHLAFAQREGSDNRMSGNHNKPGRQEWLHDLGFGMFIHFNVDAHKKDLLKEYVAGVRKVGLAVEAGFSGTGSFYQTQNSRQIVGTFEVEQIVEEASSIFQ